MLRIIGQIAQILSLTIITTALYAFREPITAALNRVELDDCAGQVIKEVKKLRNPKIMECIEKVN